MRLHRLLLFHRGRHHLRCNLSRIHGWHHSVKWLPFVTFRKVVVVKRSRKRYSRFAYSFAWLMSSTYVFSKESSRTLKYNVCKRPTASFVFRCAFVAHLLFRFQNVSQSKFCSNQLKHVSMLVSF